jgi:hypothetical protein
MVKTQPNFGMTKWLLSARTTVAAVLLVTHFSSTLPGASGKLSTTQLADGRLVADTNCANGPCVYIDGTNENHPVGCADASKANDWDLQTTCTTPIYDDWAVRLYPGVTVVIKWKNLESAADGVFTDNSAKAVQYYVTLEASTGESLHSCVCLQTKPTHCLTSWNSDCTTCKGMPSRIG